MATDLLFALQGVVSLKLKPEVFVIYYITFLSDTGAGEQDNEEVCPESLAKECQPSG